jgi:hypothetical protein
MNKLVVPYLPGVEKVSIEEISSVMDRKQRHSISISPWPEYPYKPEVSFAIAHKDDCIFIKFYIQEKFIRALNRRSNDPVFQDSCVEFFIAFDEGDGYYNLEFNCIGTCLLGFGKGAKPRSLIPEEYIQSIKRQALIRCWNEGGAMQNTWELTLAIPLKVFIYHSITSLKDRKCRVNFFKCGDELPEPHFLAWQRIESELPNFHLPEFFGTAQFASEI